MKGPDLSIPKTCTTRQRCWLSLSVLFAIVLLYPDASFSQAKDTLYFYNKTKIVGELLKISLGRIQIDADGVGIVSIKNSKIQSIHATSRSFRIETIDGKEVQGYLTRSPKPGTVVINSSLGSREINIAEIANLVGARFSSVTIEKSVSHDGIVNHNYFGMGIHSKIIDDHLCLYLSGLLFEWIEYGDESWVYVDGTEFHDLDHLLEVIFPDFDIDDPVIRGAEKDLREIDRTLQFFFNSDPNISRRIIEKMRRRTFRRLIQNFNSGFLLVEELLKRKSMTYSEVVTFLALKASELMPQLKAPSPNDRKASPLKSNSQVTDNRIRYKKDPEAIFALKAIAQFTG